MLEGLYSAAAGMAAQQERLDAVSNDLANANTPGYKHVRVAFRDLLYVSDGAPGVAAGAGAAAWMDGRSFLQGALQQTDRPLDVALQGPGFLEVRRPDGTLALTRAGSLELDGRGRLVTGTGDILVGVRPVPKGVSGDRLSIGPDGTVRAPGGRSLGRLCIVDVRSPDNLQPIGDNLFRATAASGQPLAARGTTLTQGALESSNVDVANAMVDLMDAQRTYSLASRAIQFQDQMLQVANEVKSS